MDMSHDAGQISEALARVHELTAENDATLAELAKQGVQISGLGDVRVAVLCDFVLGTLDVEHPQRIAFELGLQQAYRGQFLAAREQIEAQRARSVLLQGVNGMPPGGAGLPRGR